MNSLHRLTTGIVILAVACSRPEQPAGDSAPGDSNALAGMPGTGGSDSTAIPALDVTLSAAQIRHGGVRWATAGPATAGRVPSSGALPGQLVPNEDRTARLGAPASGRVLSVLVSPGEPVAAGRILVTLQSPDAGMAQSDLAKATAAVGSRRAQAAYATSAQQRAERLLALKAIPRQEFEKAVSDAMLAQSELIQAEAEQARAHSTAGALGAHGQPAGRLAVRSPAAGVVLERLAVPGAVVDAGAPLIVITDPRSLWLTVNAPEALAAGLRVGVVVRFVVPAFPTDTVAARVTAVGAGLDPATRTVEARATLSNQRGRFKPAMLAAVWLPEPAGNRSAGGALVLPDSAVQLVDGAPTVFVAMPNDRGGAHLMARRVELGARLGNQVAVLKGISAGELVVVAGAFAVKAELKKATMPKMEM